MYIPTSGINQLLDVNPPTHKVKSPTPGYPVIKPIHTLDVTISQSIHVTRRGRITLTPSLGTSLQGLYSRPIYHSLPWALLGVQWKIPIREKLVDIEATRPAAKLKNAKTRKAVVKPL